MGKHTWKKLPPSLSTRVKLSLAARGRKPTKEHREKISEALKGKMPSNAEARKAGWERYRAAFKPQTEEDIMEACRRTALRRRNPDREARKRQLKYDLLTAMHMGNEDLVADLKHSGGYLHLRRLFDPEGRVSHGYCKKTKQIALKMPLWNRYEERPDGLFQSRIKRG